MGLCLVLGFQGSLYASSLGYLGIVPLVNDKGEDIVILGAPCGWGALRREGRIHCSGGHRRFSLEGQTVKVEFSPLCARFSGHHVPLIPMATAVDFGPIPSKEDGLMSWGFG